MSDAQLLIEKACRLRMDALGFSGDKRYEDRLAEELWWIRGIQEADYLIGLAKSKTRFPANENNLLVCKLLGLCDEVDIDAGPAFDMGDLPDIDTDFISEVQQYIKNDYLPKEFGATRVCAICTYSTFGLKGGLKDAARIFSLPSGEINAITTRMIDKDEDNEDLTLAEARAVNPNLDAWCQANPEAADAANHIVGRNRGLNKHAGGMIVSSVDLDTIVPMVLDKQGNVMSAWTEGLARQELGPVGLVKYDVLGLKDLKRVYDACQLVFQEHGLDRLWTSDDEEGTPDWSDPAYLDDDKSMAMAEKGHLLGIFQFDSDGIRKLCREVGISNFSDIPAVSALYRPGPMDLDAHLTYAHRKQGREDWSVEPVLEPILGSTFGIMAYQEQVMKILNVIGGIPLPIVETVRKAISKKKIELFAPYKDQFVLNAQQQHGMSEERAERLWAEIEAFAGYGFNKSHAVQYGHVSSQLLALKSHYTLEMLCATLRHEEDAAKVKIYREEAERLGLSVRPLDLSRSKWTWEILDDGTGQKAIYMGFGNVKGIGEAVARQIQNAQPYEGIEDFLRRSGTGTVVLKPLICLGVFGAATRVKQWQYIHFYRERLAKRAARDKTQFAARERNIVKASTALGNTPDAERIAAAACARAVAQDLDDWIDQEPVWSTLTPDQQKAYLKAVKDYARSVRSYNAKIESEAAVPDFDAFRPDGVEDIDEEMEPLLTGLPGVAEQKFIGFAWKHYVEYSPDYQPGFNFAQFEDESVHAAAVICHLPLSPEKKQSKKGTVYYQLTLEDSSGHQVKCNVWQDDWDRFEPEFMDWDPLYAGPILKLKLSRPSGGFPTYSFFAPPRYRRSREVPAKKADDYRVSVLTRPDPASVSPQLVRKVIEPAQREEMAELGVDILDA